MRHVFTDIVLLKKRCSCFFKVTLMTSMSTPRVWRQSRVCMPVTLPCAKVAFFRSWTCESEKNIVREFAKTMWFVIREKKKYRSVNSWFVSSGKWKILFANWWIRPSWGRGPLVWPHCKKLGAQKWPLSYTMLSLHYGRSRTWSQFTMAVLEHDVLLWPFSDMTSLYYGRSRTWCHVRERP